MLGELVQRVVREWAAESGWDDIPVCVVERPAEESHGDYATPVCLQTAKTVKRPPRALAEELCARLLADEEVARLVDDVQVAGPGFINFSLSATAYAEVMRALLASRRSGGERGAA